LNSRFKKTGFTIYLIPLALMVAGITISLLVAQDLRSLQDDYAFKNTVAKAVELTRLLDNALTQSENSLRMASSLFAGSNDVNSREFQALGFSMDGTLGAVLGLENAITGYIFVDRIRRTQRRESNPSSWPLSALPFADSKPINPAAYEFYPVTMTTGEVFGLAPGMDLGNFPATYDAVSTAYRLPQKVIMSPVFATRQGRLLAIMAITVQNGEQRGVLVSLLDLSAVFDDLNLLLPNGLRYALYQVETESTSKSKRYPVITLPAGEPTALQTKTIRLSHGQARWEFVWQRFSGAVDQRSYSQATLAAATGILISLLISFILALLLRQNRQVIYRVRRRTDELEQARREADSANQAKDQILANVSHELRTPLNAIIGFSEMLSGEVLGPLGHPKYRAYADDIKFSGEHLLELINDLLDLTQANAGKIELHEQAHELSPLIDLCQRLMTPRFTELGVTLTARFPTPGVWVELDVVRIKQVLINLLSNAAKFTLPGGRVCLAAELTASGDLLIFVEDNGIGMAEEDIHKAMEPFGQIDSEVSRRFKGTGLGLPLSQKLVRLHHSDLFIDSAPGRGTRVSFTLSADRVRQVAREPLLAE
jgi:signal transduction histidine kinase